MTTQTATLDMVRWWLVCNLTLARASVVMRSLILLALVACARPVSAPVQRPQPVVHPPQPTSIYQGCDETGCPMSFAAVLPPPRSRAVALERDVRRRYLGRLAPYFPLLSGKIF